MERSLMERSLMERLMERSMMERSLILQLLTRPPLTQVLRGEDASEANGLMNCLLRRQSDPKRPRQ